MKTYIGVDLGGTNVRVGKVTAEGLVISQEKSPSYAQDGPQKVLENLKEMIRNTPDWEKCSGIGIGVPGPVDTVNGKMVLSTNLPGFAGYPFAAEMTKEFNLPVFLDNDANVAGLAEARVGAGKGLPVVFYTTISTGIGGGLTIDGKSVSGRSGFTGEIANLIIDPYRKKINYLNAGAVENEASGTAIVRKAREAMPDRTFQHAGQVIDLAWEGNEKAQRIIDGMVYDLATLFSILGAVLDPNMFVLGGGMMKSAPKFLPEVIAQYQLLVHDSLKDTPFALAKLEEPGIIGAAMLPVSRGL